MSDDDDSLVMRQKVGLLLVGRAGQLLEQTALGAPEQGLLPGLLAQGQTAAELSSWGRLCSCRNSNSTSFAGRTLGENEALPPLQVQKCWSIRRPVSDKLKH